MEKHIYNVTIIMQNNNSSSFAPININLTEMGFGTAIHTLLCRWH